MNKQQLPASLPVGLPAAARSEPERSESERSAAAGKTVLAPPIRPNPELADRPQRHRFTAADKHRILTQVEQAQGTGDIGALLRREGLYSSLLSKWRQERDAATLRALAPQKRGPKSQRGPGTARHRGRRGVSVRPSTGLADSARLSADGRPKPRA